MRTCKDCIFWKRRPDIAELKCFRPDGSHYESVDYLGECDWRGTKVEVIKTTPCHYGKCSNEKFVWTCAGGCVDEDAERTPKDGLGYSDGEAHSAYFHTGEDFGCIHYQYHYGEVREA